MKEVILINKTNDIIEAITFSELDEDQELEMCTDLKNDESYTYYLSQEEMIRVRDHIDSELKKFKK